MLIVNFSHRLTDEQIAKVSLLTGRSVERVIDVPARFDQSRPFARQVIDLVDSVDLSPDEWQSASILVVPPALNFIAVLLIAELHGRMGYFPACIRLRPIEGVVPPRYEVAEILDLHGQRHDASKNRR